MTALQWTECNEDHMTTLQKVDYILENYEGARNCDKTLVVLYWKTFDNVKVVDDIIDATTPENITRYRRELNEKGKWIATDPDVRRQRKQERSSYDQPSLF